MNELEAEEAYAKALGSNSINVNNLEIQNSSKNNAVDDDEFNYDDKLKSELKSRNGEDGNGKMRMSMLLGPDTLTSAFNATATANSNTLLLTERSTVKNNVSITSQQSPSFSISNNSNPNHSLPLPLPLPLPPSPSLHHHHDYSKDTFITDQLHKSESGIAIANRSAVIIDAKKSIISASSTATSPLLRSKTALSSSSRLNTTGISSSNNSNSRSPRNSKLIHNSSDEPFGIIGYSNTHDYGVGMHREVKIDEIHSVAIANKSNNIWCSMVNGNSKSTLIIRNLEGAILSGIPLNNLSKDEFVTSLFYVTKTNTVWAGSNEGKIFAFDEFTHVQTMNISKRKSRINCITGDEEMVFFGSVDGRVMAWDVKNKQLWDLLHLSGEANDPITAILYLSHQSIVWIATSNGGLFVYSSIVLNSENIEDDGSQSKSRISLKLIRDHGESENRQHRGNITGLVQQGLRIWSSSIDGILCVWSQNDANLLIKIENLPPITHISSILSQVWVLSNDKRIRIWDGNTIKFIGESDADAYGSKIIPVQLIDQAMIWLPATNGRLKIVRLHIPRTPPAFNIDGTAYSHSQLELQLSSQLKDLHLQEQRTYKQLKEAEGTIQMSLQNAALQDSIWRQTVDDLEAQLEKIGERFNSVVEENLRLKADISNLENMKEDWKRKISVSEDKVTKMKKEFEGSYHKRDEELKKALKSIEDLQRNFSGSDADVIATRRAMSSLLEREKYWQTSMAFVKSGYYCNNNYNLNSVSTGILDGNVTLIHCQIKHVQQLFEFIGVEDGRMLLLDLSKFIINHCISNGGSVKQMHPDNYLLAFATVIEAVQWSMTVQQLLTTEYQWPAQFESDSNVNSPFATEFATGNGSNSRRCVFRGVKVSMAIHSCEIKSNNGDEIHIASDICTLMAEEGQILVSKPTWDSLKPNQISALGYIHIEQLPTKLELISNSSSSLTIYSILPLSLMGRVFANSSPAKEDNKSNGRIAVERKESLMDNAKSEFENLMEQSKRICNHTNEMVTRQEESKTQLAQLRQVLVEIQTRLRLDGGGEDPLELLGDAFVRLETLCRRQDNIGDEMNAIHNENQDIMKKISNIDGKLQSSMTNVVGENAARDKYSELSNFYQQLEEKYQNSHIEIDKLNETIQEINWQLRSAKSTIVMQNELMEMKDNEIKKYESKIDEVTKSRDKYQAKYKETIDKLNESNKINHHARKLMELEMNSIYRKLMEVKSKISQIVKTSIQRGEIQESKKSLTELTFSIEKSLADHVRRVEMKLSLGLMSSGVSEKVKIHEARKETMTLTNNNNNNNENEDDDDDFEVDDEGANY